MVRETSESISSCRFRKAKFLDFLKKVGLGCPCGVNFLWFPVPTFWVGGIVKTIVLITSSQRAWALYPGHCVSIKLGSTLPAQDGHLLSFCCCGVGCQPGAESCMYLLHVVKVFCKSESRPVSRPRRVKWRALRRLCACFAFHFYVCLN